MSSTHPSSSAFYITQSPSTTQSLSSSYLAYSSYNHSWSFLEASSLFDFVIAAITCCYCYYLYCLCLIIAAEYGYCLC